ncbi:NAD-dependent epimerase [Marinigracilibium pacificum]|uniref:NAD-dependent epimerase n=1 Tax=Marinigracilibium pacificum TaxID=2729599 RepID=A0A848IWK8_9BACT|nr:NAD-dependent epimerase [Marinigracilibium pacificum]NMM48056.1 NAD-dependent epimerase [Marinigracilibium pacificum]
MSNTSKKILVTGAAGFIGFHLVKKLLERGDEVIGLDNISDYYDVNLKFGRLAELAINREEITEGSLVQSKLFSGFRFIKHDLKYGELLMEICQQEKFEVIVNLAAQAGVRYSVENPQVYIDANIQGFLNILEAARHTNIKNLVYASSSSVYGLNSKMPFSVKHETDHPLSLYAATKKSNEMMAHTYSHLFNIPTTGLRFFTVYGPWGRPDMALFLFADAIKNDKSLKVFNNGDMGRDFTYIDDIVEGVVKTIDKPAESTGNNGSDPTPDVSTAPYRIYNIGSNNPVRLMDYIETLETAFGKEAKKEFLPMQPGDVKNTYADVSELKTDFDYKPDTPLEKGVKAFVDWYNEYYS